MGAMDGYIRFLRSKLGDALVVAAVAGAVVRDAEGRVLLQKRAGEGSWGLPGGWIAPGESAMSCAMRETLEETGWDVELTGLLGVYTAAETQTHTYPNGHRAQFISMVFEARALRRVGAADAETDALAFFAGDALPSPIHRPDRLPIADALSSAARPFLR